MGWAWTSAPELLFLIRTPASAEARAEAESTARYACEQYEHRCDQSDDGREAKRHADPVGDCSKDDGDEDSDHLLSLLGRWRSFSQKGLASNPGTVAVMGTRGSPGGGQRSNFGARPS